MADFLDKAKDLAKKNEDKIDAGLDKVAELVDKKTGGKHSDKVQQAVGKIGDVIDKATAAKPTKKYGKPEKPASK